MAALYKARRIGHVALRDRLSLTDGNVATHVRRLESEGYLRASRALSGVSFVVVYDITPAGADAFKRYLAALADLVDEHR